MNMRGSNRIEHRPYLPPTRLRELSNPYVCRLAPYDVGFELEWLDKENTGEYTILCAKRGEALAVCAKATGRKAKVEGLAADCDYEICVESADGRRSNVRLVRTGRIPEGSVVINYLHPEDTQYDFSGRYLCSPSLARVKSGRLIAGMDLFGGGMAQNLTILFYSDDDGNSWNYLTDLYPFYWATLFVHRDVLYILGLTTEYGNLQIACSKDEGKTWSAPVTLFYGSNMLCDYGGVHRAPMHMVTHNGRIYTTVEYGCWRMNSHLPSVLSIGEDEDLLVPENWVRTEILPFDGAWKEAAQEPQKDTMEGNIVIAPDGQMYSFLRWGIEKLLKLRVDMDDPDRMLEFAGFMKAPVVNSMFRLFRSGDKYILITNRKTEASAKIAPDFPRYRNVLSMFESTDLENFTFVKDIYNDENEHPGTVGFQYPAFLCEDGQISLVVRSAFNQPHNEHDSNYSLFCRI